MVGVNIGNVELGATTLTLDVEWESVFDGGAAIDFYEVTVKPLNQTAVEINCTRIMCLEGGEGDRGRG